MNRPQDILLTTVKGFGWPEMSAFIISVERSGFSGDKIMFIEDVPEDARDRLVSKGWQLVNVVADPSQSYATARHIPVRDYLAENKSRYRYALYIDVRDAVFQSDPSFWLELHLTPAKIVGPSECMLIKNQPTNSIWITQTLGEEVLSWLGEYDVFCCGTIFGEAETVAYTVEKMCELSAKISGWGFDQAYFNYLLRIPPLKDVMRPVRMSDGFIVTCSWYLSCPGHWAPWVNDVVPNFDRSRVLVCPPGSDIAYPLLHQYDRDLWWKEAIERKYSE